MSRNLRKRERSASPDGAAAGPPLAAVLQQVREDQRARRAAPGVDASRLVAPAAAPPGPAPAALSVAPAPSAAASVADDLLGFGHFAAAGGGGAVVGDADEDPRMLAFVEERLRLLRERESGATIPSSSSASSSSSSSSASSSTFDLRAEDIIADPLRLYELPASLRPGGGGKSATAASAAAAAAAAAGDGPMDADVGAGGMMLGGTGITEVLLPSAFRERNELETAAVVRMLLANRARTGSTGGMGGGAARSAAFGPELVRPRGREGEGEEAEEGASVTLPSRFLAGSITANYSQHRREHALGLMGVATSATGTALFDARKVPSSSGDSVGAGAGGGTSSSSAGSGKGGAQRHHARESGGAGGDKRDQPTDAKTFAAFKKREMMGLLNR